jgi:hypothetical protein
MSYRIEFYRYERKPDEWDTGWGDSRPLVLNKKTHEVETKEELVAFLKKLKKEKTKLPFYFKKAGLSNIKIYEITLNFIDFESQKIGVYKYQTKKEYLNHP